MKFESPVDFGRAQPSYVQPSPRPLKDRPTEGKAARDSGPYAENALLYIEAGYSPIPEKPGTKRPAIEGHSNYCERPPTKEEAARWASSIPGAGIALALGYDGLVAIDIDTDEAEIIEAVKNTLPEIRVSKRGQKGFTTFFRFPNGRAPIASFRGKGTEPGKLGKPIVEILGHGRKTTIPPSIHPDTGKPYEWVGGKGLLDAQFENLPELPADIEARLEEALRPWLADKPSWGEKDRLVEARPDGEFSDAERKRYESHARACISGRANDLSAMGKDTGRNGALFTAACYLGKFAFHGLVSQSEIESTLVAASETNGLLREDGKPSVLATIRSGLRRAQNDPLPSLPERPFPGAETAEAPLDRPPDEWGEPQPIDAPLLPVPPFPEELLPEALRDFIMDAAHRMPCAPDYVAAATLAALGATVGARCAIRPKCLDHWAVVPNLWGGIVGNPSEKKSPAISEGMKPLGSLINRAIKDNEKAAANAEGMRLIHDARKEAIEVKLKAEAKSKNVSDDKLKDLADELSRHTMSAQEKPTLRRYKTNDTTVEKLGELLRENPGGILVLRDELVGLLASWDRDGREGDRAFFLEGWNGTEPYDTDRIGRGSILIPNLCVSVFGGIQPDKLIAYLEQAANAFTNDGMLQRFQVLVYPDPVRWEYRDLAPNKSARDRVYAVFDALDGFDPVEWGAQPADDFVKFPRFGFTKEAQEVYKEWAFDLHRAIEKENEEGHPLVAQHLAKFEKLFAALALLFHLVECADSGTRGPVTKTAALLAAAWCDYLERHARRCYGLLTDSGLRAAKALTSKLRKGGLSDGFTARDVRQKQWRHLTTDGAIKPALDWLEDAQWVRPEDCGGTGPGSGRKTTRYRINPAILGAAHE